MNRLFTIILFLITYSVFAQTNVTGNQSGTWNTSGSPYIVTGNITVPSGEILTVEPGVTINFQGHYQFKINGKLIAEGTESDSIIFTAENTNTGWGGIRVNSSQVSLFKYCKIEYGKTQGDYPNVHGGGVALFSSNAVFEHCVFYHNQADTGEDGMGGAVYALNTTGATQFSYCRFIANHAFGEGGAVKFSSANGVEFFNCEFIGNNCKYGGGAVSCYSAANIKFAFTLFTDNYTLYSGGGAIQTLGMANSLTFENSTFYGNSANNGDGGAVSLAYAEASFVNSIIFNNPGAYSDNIYLDIAASASINYCNTPMPDGAEGNNNINTNPMFVNAAQNDFHLTENSPCVDAGTDIGYDYLGTAPDMGCFEFDPATYILNMSAINKPAIFPNPAKETVNILVDTKTNLSWQLYDLSGKIIKTGNTHCFSVIELAKGTYVIKIFTKTGTDNLKLIVQ